jgi:hypothetical protein
MVGQGGSHERRFTRVQARIFVSRRLPELADRLLEIGKGTQTSIGEDKRLRRLPRADAFLHPQAWAFVDADIDLGMQAISAGVYGRTDYRGEGRINQQLTADDDEYALLSRIS